MSSVAARLNQDFQKLGATGITVIFASGDNGVGCSAGRFMPNYPASSPYVTSVGGNEMGMTQVCCDPLSAGGFSWNFSRPSYQDAAVASFVAASKGNLPKQSMWNKNGRAVPDLSGYSEELAIVLGGIKTEAGGTSVAAPMIAGIVTLLNDHRLAQGKPPLGFLNPWLYQTQAAHPEAFIDITAGSNPGCGTDGFEAVKGFDPATGLGAIAFETILQYLPA